MSSVCQVTGKTTISGHRVSHANNKTKRQFKANIQTKRFWLASENRFVKLRVSAKGIKIITKKGIDAVIGEIRKNGGRI